MLEELSLEYKVHPIDIGKDQQFDSAFLKVSPNNKIPAIIDHESNMTLMESGAILLYLAEKTDKLLPQSSGPRLKVIEWLMWQMGGVGPTLGQAHHFLHFNPGVCEYAEKRYAQEANRLYGVLNRQLAQKQFIAGEYSIADIATWPWICRFEWQGVDIYKYGNVCRWYRDIAARVAVQRGYNVPLEQEIPLP